VVRFEGRTEGGEKGHGGGWQRPFQWHGGGRGWRKGGGSGIDVHVEEGEGRRGGPGVAVGSSGRLAMAPDRWAWAAPCHTDRGARGADR
jgi:hypothetical protein